MPVRDGVFGKSQRTNKGRNPLGSVLLFHLIQLSFDVGLFLFRLVTRPSAGLALPLCSIKEDYRSISSLCAIGRYLLDSTAVRSLRTHTSFFFLHLYYSRSEKFFKGVSQNIWQKIFQKGVEKFVEMCYTITVMKKRSVPRRWDRPFFGSDCRFVSGARQMEAPGRNALGIVRFRPYAAAILFGGLRSRESAKKMVRSGKFSGKTGLGAGFVREPESGPPKPCQTASASPWANCAL